MILWTSSESKASPGNPASHFNHLHPLHRSCLLTVSNTDDRGSNNCPWREHYPSSSACFLLVSQDLRTPHVTAPWWGPDQQTLTQTFWTPDESNEAVTPLLPNTWFASQQVHKGDAYSDLVSKYLVDQKQTFDTKAGTRTIKVRLFPDAPQRKVLDQAFCAYRTTRATCVRWIRQHQRHAERLVKQSAVLNPLKMLLRSKFMTGTLGDWQESVLLG